MKPNNIVDEPPARSSPTECLMTPVSSEAGLQASLFRKPNLSCAPLREPYLPKVMAIRARESADKKVVSIEGNKSVVSRTLSGTRGTSRRTSLTWHQR